MGNIGEVIIERDGKKYGAIYSVRAGMLEVRTHTESRSLELRDRDPEALARSTLTEIINAQPSR
jgi:hypothetical protein